MYQAKSTLSWGMVGMGSQNILKYILVLDLFRSDIFCCSYGDFCNCLHSYILHRHNSDRISRSTLWSRCDKLAILSFLVFIM